MKKNIIPKLSVSLRQFYLLLLFIPGILRHAWGQQPTNTDASRNYVNVNTPKTPESAAFEKYGDVQVNEFTGTTNVAIPVYSLRSRFLEVPITLSYQATGIKVNQEASWVGLGFDLLAGGRVSVETRGDVDFSIFSHGAMTPNLQAAMTQIFTRLGNSRENAVLTPATFWDPPYCGTCPSDPNLYNGLGISEMTQYGSGEPDIFRANFNGQSVAFYVDKISNTIKFLGEQSNFKITYTLDGYHNVTEWKIVDDAGVTYHFDQLEIITNTLPGSAIVPTSTTSAWLLTQMIHPSGDNIQFTYGNYGYSVPAFSMSGSIDVSSQAGTTVSSDQNQNIGMHSPYYLTRVESANVAVDFFLETRTDLYGPGSRKLSQIKVTDKLSNTVKKTVLFNYSYFQATAHQSIHSHLNSLTYALPPSLSKTAYLQCSSKRLRLDSVHVNDNSRQPPYRFYYNSLAVDKYSYSQDHWGYYNGILNNSNGYYAYSFSQLIPYLGLRGVQNYMPSGGLGFDTAYIGNSREPDANYMQAMILDSVVYPTGGSSRFAYEPHQSVMLPTINITGGGIRVKSIKTYTGTILAGTKEFTYANGKYMGTIKYATNSNELNQCFGQTPGIIAHSRYSSDGAINFNDILIGYGQITVVQKDAAGQPNGSVVKTFNVSTPSSNYSNGVGFDIQPPYFAAGEPVTGPTGLTYDQWLTPEFTCFPPTPSSCLEGKLMQEQYFDNSSNLLKSVNYYYRLANYSNNFYAVKAIQNRVGGFSGSCPDPMNGYGSGGLRPVNLFVSPAKSFRAVTDSIVEKTYQGSNFIKQKKSFTYDSRYQVNTESSYNSDNSVTTVSYTRSYDYLGTGINGSTAIPYEMTGRNLISTVYSTTVRRNGSQIDSVFNLYHKPFTGVFVPQNTQIQTGANPMETRQVYNAYDSYGHLLERQKPGGVKENYLWGYNKQFPVASVIGSDHATLAGMINAAILDNPSSDVALRAELNKLRGLLPAAMVTSYTYDPVYGLTSETDPRGKTKFYDYDALGRLVLIRDDDNNILKKICYNYAGQPENCNMWGNGQVSQNFTRSNNSCETDYAGTQGSYTVQANKYFSAIGPEDANAKAQADIDFNGQNYVNTNPASGATCIPMVKCTNSGTIPYTVNFTHTTTGITSSFSANPMTSFLQIGQIAYGTYNVQFVPNVTAQSEVTLNGVSQTGGMLTFNNVVVDAPVNLTITPVLTGSCSLSMNSGYTSPTNSFGNDGINAYFYIAFYSSSVITAGNTYTIGMLSNGCRPASAQTIPNYTTGGRTWTITIQPGGQMQWYLHPGSPDLSANTTVVTSSLTYSLN